MATKSIIQLSLLFSLAQVIWCCGLEEGQQIGFNEAGFVKDTSVGSLTSSHFQKRRRKREASIEDRKACGDGDKPPKTRIDTTQRLEALRDKLNSLNLAAFLVPSGDSHQSEYVALADKRRHWIGGFSGSSGFAVVTQDKAAMWTDGRYYIQAEDQLDCNWLFMKGAEDDDASWYRWLARELSPGDRIGADPSLTGALTWLEWEKFFEKQGKNLTLVRTNRNPIDDVWLSRPERPRDPLEIHPVEYAGKTWEDKVAELRNHLQSEKADAIIITALDEIAWLFNLRGNDIPYTPVFRGYGVIDQTKAILYIPPEKQTIGVKEHLKSDNCAKGGKECAQLRDYEAILEDLPSLQESWSTVLMGKKYAYSGGASFAIYGLISAEKRKLVLSPVMLMKAQKNEVEIEGMKAAHVRDAIALIEFADILESEMRNGQTRWDELKAAKKLKELREQQPLNRGLSFPSISAYGGNGAVIHYKPNNVTNTQIGRDAFYLLDSGGQYLDGTTDVTRTFHYGTPTPFEIEVYTRVLMGAIDLARATFLDGTPDTRLDILARWNLYQVGLNYRHGTGHGIGAYGFIHESPVQVRVYSKEEHPMREGYFFSDEPGYYEAGVGGVRLETILMTVKRNSLKHRDKKYGDFLGFEPVCLVPFEPHLIDYEMLSQEQLNWLNKYNLLIRDKVGPELLKQEKKSAYEWMMARTEPLHYTKREPRFQRSGATISSATFSLTKILLFCLMLIFVK